MQKIQLDLGGLSVSEKDELFNYQLLAEITHEVTSRFMWGLRYRWIQIDEMETFFDAHYIPLKFRRVSNF